MNPHRTAVAVILALLLAVSLAGPARAQEKVKPAADRSTGVHRLEVWNGPVRTVYYLSHGTSPGEESSLRDLERTENDLAITDEVQGLRRLYVRNERALAERSGVVNPLLYGYSSQYAVGLPPGTAEAAYYGGTGAAPYGFGGFGGFAGVNPYAYAGLLPPRGVATNSLALGVGNEGVMKNELVRGLAAVTGPEGVARTTRAYDTAVARVAESDRLRAGLGWGQGNVAAVAHERRVGGPVSVTTKDGKTLDGTLVNQGQDWITLETATEEVSLRMSDVTRVTRPKK